MCNSVNNTYKKHLPVYIYKHSSLIEPVEITALQIIIIIDPSEIHSPRLNILIYYYKLESEAWKSQNI